MLLFDHSHPREKPCGGGVTGRALALVADVIAIPALPARVVRAARFFDDTGRSAAVPLRADAVAPEPGLIVVSRSAFDGVLVDAAAAAGAELVAERVIGVTVDGTTAIVRTRAAQHRAAWLVGADGANSFVCVAGSPRRSAASSCRLLLATTPMVSPPTKSCSNSSPIRPDICGGFRRPTHLAIGICAHAPDAGAALLRARTQA